MSEIKIAYFVEYHDIDGIWKKTEQLPDAAAAKKEEAAFHADGIKARAFICQTQKFFLN